MEYSAIITIIIKILAAVISILITSFYPKVREYINTKISQQQFTQIMTYTKMFVLAAEQQLKQDDPDGTKRKTYVVEQLKLLGIEVTEQVDAMIEAQVLQINK